MFINLRRKKHFKRKFAASFLLLGSLAACLFFLNMFIISRKPLFISPMGKASIDLTGIERALRDNHILFSGIIFSDYTYLIDIPNNGQVKLSQNKDISRQIASLQRILNQLTIEGKPFKSIDFRFDEPVVSF